MPPRAPILPPPSLQPKPQHKILRRFAEYHDLAGAFGRRAVIERAKGILMERHAVDEASAFAMLRDRSRTDNRRLIDLASAVVDGHRLLLRQPQPGPPRP